MNAPDLTQRPPRSVRVRLGGMVLLPRMLDKCRATIAGKNGEYHYDCPMDQHWLNFTQIKADDLKAQVEAGKGDGDILAWVLETSPANLSPWNVQQWSAFTESRVPTDNETREFYNGMVEKAGGAKREDIGTWFEFLDLDDYVTFGGVA